MEELLKLATAQLVQFKEIAPELMRQLIEIYTYRLHLYHVWSIIVPVCGGLALAIGIIGLCKNNYYADWPVVPIVIGAIFFVIGILMAIDYSLSKKFFDVSPEIYILKKILSQ